MDMQAYSHVITKISWIDVLLNFLSWVPGYTRMRMELLYEIPLKSRCLWNRLLTKSTSLPKNISHISSLQRRLSMVSSRFAAKRSRFCYKSLGCIMKSICCKAIQSFHCTMKLFPLLKNICPFAAYLSKFPS